MPPLAALSGITKEFGTLRALDGVDLAIGPGEVIAIVGENGAGKTTLMRVLAGLIEARGEISFDGQAVRLSGARDGMRHGVGFVQQHYGLIDELTGTQNFILGSPDHGVRRRGAATEARLLALAEQLDLDVDPSRLVRNLNIGQKQRLEILIAVASGARILILDEPTAALGPEDSKRLNEIIRNYTASGSSVVYISHKLHDVMEIATRIVVMRKGKVVSSYPRERATMDQIAIDMVGRLVPQPEVERATPGEPVASLVGVSVESLPHRKGLVDVSLVARRREILGVAGVVGSGQDALADLLAGLLHPSEGEIELTPRVGYVPEDRAGKAMAADLSVAHNLVVHTHRDRRFSRGGRLWWPALRQHALGLVDNGGVSVHDITTPLGQLSGGNQQKVVLIRELERDPDILVAHNPYRGLDVGAVGVIRKSLIAARDTGSAVVLISSDLDDLFDISDRIIVLCDGRLAGEVDPRTATVREVGLMMAGAA
jgi:general nucleoside transport system ATP-binding protein